MANLNDKTDNFSFFGASNRKNNSYNYGKIAGNIENVCIALQLHFSEAEIKGVKSKVTQFIDCKTKGQSNESKIKKAIRAKYQKFLTLMEEQKENKEIYNKYVQKDKELQNLLF